MTNAHDNDTGPFSPADLKKAIAHHKADAERLMGEAEYSMRLANVYSELLSLLQKPQTVHAMPADARMEALDATAVATPPEKGRDLTKLTYAEAAREVLRGNPRPMSTTEILEALKLRGREVAGKDPSNTIYTSLYRDSRIERVDGKWRLKESVTTT